MQGTIKEVITLFDEDIDRDRYENAIKVSCVNEFISDTTTRDLKILNEKGSGLSLGEMERIAIARAIYSDAPILLLDECSASLDEETEKRVISNILSMKNKTIILISHHNYKKSLFTKIIDLGE